MSRSPNRSKPERGHIALTTGVVTLRDAAEYRARLMDIDFSGPRERLVGVVLAARIASPTARQLRDMTLADRHWLIALLMLRDGIRDIEIGDVCSHCGEWLELRLDLEAAVRDGELAMKQPVAGLRLPTVRDLEQANDVDVFIATFTGGGDAAEIERQLSEADPFGSIGLNARCCQCGHEVRVEIDLPARWLAAQRRIGGDLLQEVDTLASHYHWSEREILALSESRRRVYIALCRAGHEADSLEQQAYV